MKCTRLSIRRMRELSTGSLRAAIAVAALCSLPVADSRAADDGGTRSVFADGAGNRALALGGAYVAIADDASAPVWNPGGLAFVARRELQASHTNLFGIGFSEQYMSFVLPSWRFGTASLTARTFGVGGVETRDDRNVLIGEDLSSNEMEVALGFGRRVGDFWGVGGAVKIQRQSVGESADIGIGLDLGVRTYPLAAMGSTSALADRLTFGLALRNALQPRLRLVEDSVSDPSVLRTGIGYQQPVGEGRSITWALDLESTNDMDPRVHAGVELSLVPALALRGGMNAGNLEAGVGTRLGDFGFDYVFEDNTLGSIHRFGLNYAFGHSVDEQRGAYYAAQEAELQEKLAAAFEDRTRARLEALVDETEAALASRRSTDALENIAILEVLDPNDPRIAGLEARALLMDGLALEARGDVAAAVVALGRASTLAPDDAETSRALARVRAALASRTAQSNESRELMRAALDALAGDDLAGARDGFRAVIARFPDDDEARRMLEKTEEAIARRVDNLLEQARTLAEARLFDDANAALNAALALRPGDARLDAVASSIRALREAPAPVAAVAPKATAPTPTSRPSASKGDAKPARRTLTAEERRQIENLYRLAMDAASDGRIDDAVRYWEFVWASDPNHADVSEHLKREYLARGMEAFATGALEAAVEEWNNVLRIDPGDARAKGYLRRAQEQETRFREIVRDSRVAETD